PFDTGVLYWLHTLFPPSFALLRIPALVANLLLVVLGFALIRRVAPRGVALVTAFLLAVWPVNIAYSRFGWDPSQVSVFVFLAIYCALARYPLGAVIAFLCGCVAHPTAVFAGPAVV